ncbi:nucleotide-diphospho-sugar transferase [Mrakia frigida]|uniref:nucleotide-diphospho-sugar transferase n=1 Tax=Mrakia frigida TaxID=29902 RepID=UPI003FCC0B0F
MSGRIPQDGSRSKLLTILSFLLLTSLAFFLVPSRTSTSLWPKDSAPLVVRDIPVAGCLNDEIELDYPREKGCILILGRNEDEDELKSSLLSFESMFNARYKYPYCLLSDTPFKASFLASLRTVLHEGAVIHTGLVTHEQGWGMPDWMDKEEARRKMKAMGKSGVQYGEKESYHNMCRFYTGPFANHPLLAGFDWYWRLEPSVKFFCKLTYDPFRFLAQNNKLYGFNIAVIENINTIPTLFPTISEYRNDLIKKGEIQPTDFWKMFEADGWGNHGWGEPAGKDGKPGYNTCHFWTNFEIGNLNFLRGKQYQDLFEHLDRKKGFYHERWGDAPIRSLALALFSNFTQTHFFEDIAYVHDTWMHCPLRDGIGCECECKDKGPAIGEDAWYSCLARWKEINALHV